LPASSALEAPSVSLEVASPVFPEPMSPHPLELVLTDPLSLWDLLVNCILDNCPPDANPRN
jgi:hypothetical protein